MGYSRPHVKEALLAARRDGHATEGLMVGDRETEIVLERMGYLPINQDEVDKRVQDWYVANGLVLREPATTDPPPQTPNAPADTPGDTRGDTPEKSAVALEAAEAALAAAAAALRLARLSA